MIKRQLIINALITVLSGIKISNGYSSNIGDNVYDYRSMNFNDKNTPAIMVYDFSNDIDPEYAGAHMNRLSVRIDVISLEDDVVNLREHISDIYLALGNAEDSFWRDYTAELIPDRDEMSHEKETVSVGAGQIFIIIKYPVSKWGLN